MFVRMFVNIIAILLLAAVVDDDDVDELLFFFLLLFERAQAKVQFVVISRVC